MKQIPAPVWPPSYACRKRRPEAWDEGTLRQGVQTSSWEQNGHPSHPKIKKLISCFAFSYRIIRFHTSEGTNNFKELRCFFLKYFYLFYQKKNNKFLPKVQRNKKTERIVFDDKIKALVLE